MAFAPDDSGMIPRDPKKDPRQNQGGGQGLLGAFLPGQRGLLARQLSQGFGGQPGDFAQYLSMLYRPTFRPMAFHGGGFGGMGRPNTTPAPGDVYENDPSFRRI